MTIAVTPFDGLCGFRPLVEIVHFLSHVPSLRKLVGDSAAKEFEEAVRGQETSDSSQDVEKNKKALQAAFSALMNAEKPAIVSAAKELIASAIADGESFAGNGGPSNGGQELADLVVRLNSQFEGDIGLFVLFFLNYVELEVGEAMFLKADDIHAYLSGGVLPSLPLSHRSADRLPPARYYRMHGIIRQRGPCRLHAQVSRHPNPHEHADILVRTHLIAEDVAGRLPVRDPEPDRLQLRLQRDPVRPPNRGVQRRQDGPDTQGREGHLRAHRRPQHHPLHRGTWHHQRGTHHAGGPPRLRLLCRRDGRVCARELRRRQRALHHFQGFLRVERERKHQRRHLNFLRA